MGKPIAALLAVTLVLSALGMSACRLAPGNASDICSATPIHNVGKQPEIQPSPNQSGITAYLQTGKPVYARRTTRIVWFVQNDAAGPDLQVVAGINTKGTHFSKTFPKTNVSSGQSVYDSQMVFPEPGCWGVAVNTGSTEGTFDLQVATPPS